MIDDDGGDGGDDRERESKRLVISHGYLPHQVAQTYVQHKPESFAERNFQSQTIQVKKARKQECKRLAISHRQPGPIRWLRPMHTRTFGSPLHSGSFNHRQFHDIQTRDRESERARDSERA